MNSIKLGIFYDGLTIPPKEGLTVHTYELALALAKSGKVDVTFIAADRGRVDESTLACQPFDTMLLPPDDYYDRDFIRKLLVEHKFDVVQNYKCYYIASILGPVIEELNIPLVTEHHDLESDLSFLHSNKDQTQYHARIQEIAIDYSVVSRVMSKYDFDQLLKSVSPELQTKLFWKPVAMSTSTSVCKYSKNVLFVGNMSYPPNRAAALRIIKDIAPKLPTYNFLLVGRESDSFGELLQSQNVALLGEVDDLNSVLSESALGIAPLEIGSGMKIKIPTYLSAGLPVVATKVALSGFPDSTALIRADSNEDFITSIEELLNNESEWQKRSEAAKALYLKHYHINHTIESLVDMYQNAAKSKLTRVSPGEDIGMPDMEMFPWHLELRKLDVPHVRTLTYVRGNKA